MSKPTKDRISNPRDRVNWHIVIIVIITFLFLIIVLNGKLIEYSILIINIGLSEKIFNAAAQLAGISIGFFSIYIAGITIKSERESPYFTIQMLGKKIQILFKP